jgi:hypothetical protein
MLLLLQKWLQQSPPAPQDWPGWWHGPWTHVPPWQIWVLQQSASVVQLASYTQWQVLVLSSQNPLQQSPPNWQAAPGWAHVLLVHTRAVEKVDAAGQPELQAWPAGQQ